MAEASILSPGQFSGKRQKRTDPHGDTQSNMVKFSGDPGQSKTMKNAGSHLPKAPDKHPHHRKSGRRSHRVA
jgi:hypothetical protein